MTSDHMNSGIVANRKAYVWRCIFFVFFAGLFTAFGLLVQIHSQFIALVARVETASNDYGIHIQWEPSRLADAVRSWSPDFRMPKLAKDYLIDLWEIEATIDSGEDVPPSVYSDLAHFRRINRIWWENENGSSQILRVVAKQRNLKELSLHGVTVDNQLLAHPALFEHLELLEIDGSAADHFDGEFLVAAREYRKLWQLTLNGARLSDKACHQIGQFVYLSDLNLSRCRLTSAQAAAFDRLRNLRRLDLADTLIDDGFAATLTAFSELESLDISGTRMTASGLSSLRSCRLLKVLATGSIRGSAKLLESLQNCPDLWVLDVPWGGDLKSEDFFKFERFKSVDELTFVDNCVSDSAAKALSNCRHLNRLEIASNRLTLQGIEFLMSMPKLAVLRLSGKDYEPELVDVIQKSKSLTKIGLLERDWPRSEWSELRARLVKKKKGEE